MYSPSPFHLHARRARTVNRSSPRRVKMTAASRPPGDSVSRGRKDSGSDGRTTLLQFDCSDIQRFQATVERLQATEQISSI
ncbi:MAG: hypothetical protein R2873_02925 [Caldilineaceae bacterium]